MNEIIERMVRGHVPEAAGKQLSFVKLNTAGSPMRRRPKVLFLCFFDNAAFPSVCLKTVRSKMHNEVIVEGCRILEELQTIGGKKFFPSPIWLGEEDGIAWSIETAFPGKKPTSADARKVVEAYLEFARQTLFGKRSVDASQKARELIASVECPAEDKAALEKLWSEVAVNEVLLLPQHGDCTPDNVLVSNEGVHFIDCDRFTKEGIAGFDLFYFLSRIPHKESDIRVYLSSYRELIGMTRSFTAGDVFLWGLQDEVVKSEASFPFSLKNFMHWYEEARKSAFVA